MLSSGTLPRSGGGVSRHRCPLCPNSLAEAEELGTLAYGRYHFGSSDLAGWRLAHAVYR